MGMGREWELNLRHHGNGIGNGNELMGMGREWELNLRHHGNGIGNGNELMGMGREWECCKRFPHISTTHSTK